MGVDRGSRKWRLVPITRGFFCRLESSGDGGGRKTTTRAPPPPPKKKRGNAQNFALLAHCPPLSLPRFPLLSLSRPSLPRQLSLLHRPTGAATPEDNKRKGVYVGSVGGLPLFTSDCKFDSGTGWPSFWAPIDPAHVIEIKDTSIPFMTRVEVVDARSGAHLGHGTLR